ncbi:MAG TPA: nucleotidyl transferase AbiEii/AbiGii toxin family protein [Methylomirabilota bacterium]|nr:nucleotidyl transferase AbiEii/AbiGii toxin family protein [Methylomirabilota bacterium]
MTLVQNLEAEAARRGLRFIVIGGHAVIEHGFQRGTEDVDILVSKTNRAEWIQCVEGLGYRLWRDGGTFLQFESGDDAEWELDLMLVPEDAFARLFAASRPATLEQAAVVVVSLEHLIALKVHALKNGHGLRVLKDLTDVAQLLRLNRVDPRAVWVRNIFGKHGTDELYEKVIKLVSE